jgi:chromosome segregation ATPase
MGPGQALDQRLDVARVADVQSQIDDATENVVKLEAEIDELTQQLEATDEAGRPDLLEQIDAKKVQLSQALSVLRERLNQQLDQIAEKTDERR